MILVDSSVWIDYFKGLKSPQADRLDNALSQDIVAIGDLMLVEVLQGFDRDRDFERARHLLASLEQIEIAGTDIAVQAARHFRQLRSMGVTVRKTIDSLIATRCIAESLPLLFSDRDFAPFVEHLGLVDAMDVSAAHLG